MCLLVYTEDFADDADQGADPGDDASAPAPSTDVRRSDSDDDRRRQRRRRRSSSDSDSDVASASGRTVCRSFMLIFSGHRAGRKSATAMVLMRWYTAAFTTHILVSSFFRLPCDDTPGVRKGAV